MMKNTLILALVCIALGFAAGWLAKPESTALVSDETAARSTSRAQSAPSGRSSSGFDKPKSARRSGSTAKKDLPDDGIDPGTKKAMNKAQNQQVTMIKKGLKSKFDMRADLMVKELGLNAEQEKIARDYFAAQLEKMNADSMTEMMTGETDMAKLAAAMRGDGLNDHLKDVLSDEQLDGLENLQKRKKNNKIESMAMKDLAGLQQTLDLTNDQKDKVYDVLIEDSEKRLAGQSDGDFVARTMMASMGMEMHFDDMDMGELINIQKQGKGAGDMASLAQQMKDNRQTKIDAKVERMTPILDESQISQYRKSLEGNRGMFDMMIQSMENQPKSK